MVGLIVLIYTLIGQFLRILIRGHKQNCKIKEYLDDMVVNNYSFLYLLANQDKSNMDPPKKPPGGKRKHGDLPKLPSAVDKRMKTKETKPEEMVDISLSQPKPDEDEKIPPEKVELEPEEDEEESLGENESESDEDEKKPPEEGPHRRLTHSFAPPSEVQIPDGVSSFSDLRNEENKFIAVDKSMFIAELLTHRRKKAMLITRPRRFGKSILLTMLGDFLDNKHSKEEINKLFTELDISKWKYKDSYMGKYPVVLLNLNAVNGTTIDGWEFDLERKIIEFARNKFGEEISTAAVAGKTCNAKFLKNRIEAFDTTGKIENINCCRAIENLILFLNAYYKSCVVILFDEYDAPYENVKHKPFASAAWRFI
eukprot:TRINITY_DN121951_c0_g1_i1.p2 TRINITY_DN121951_c0_g1~~TRINITY_DN121951_c0_g1_i1.p2  ORF type:complete len:368 (+),score=39.55 TRINITY_DN121951_c0_g1_i1:248-1351(+)